MDLTPDNLVFTLPNLDGEAFSASKLSVDSRTPGLVVAGRWRERDLPGSNGTYVHTHEDFLLTGVPISDGIPNWSQGKLRRPEEYLPPPRAGEESFIREVSVKSGNSFGDVVVQIKHIDPKLIGEAEGPVAREITGVLFADSNRIVSFANGVRIESVTEDRSVVIARNGAKGTVRLEADPRSGQNRTISRSLESGERTNLELAAPGLRVLSVRGEDNPLEKKFVVLGLEDLRETVLERGEEVHGLSLDGVVVGLYSDPQSSYDRGDEMEFPAGYWNSSGQLGPLRDFLGERMTDLSPSSVAKIASNNGTGASHLVGGRDVANAEDKATKTAPGVIRTIIKGGLGLFWKIPSDTNESAYGINAIRADEVVDTNGWEIEAISELQAPSNGRGVACVATADNGIGYVRGGVIVSRDFGKEE